MNHKNHTLPVPSLLGIWNVSRHKIRFPREEISNRKDNSESAIKKSFPFTILEIWSAIFHHFSYSTQVQLCLLWQNQEVGKKHECVSYMKYTLARCLVNSRGSIREIFNGIFTTFIVWLWKLREAMNLPRWRNRWHVDFSIFNCLVKWWHRLNFPLVVAL